MAISINDIVNGMGLLINGELYLVLEYNHVKPGKGAAFVRVRIRNIKTGQVLERTFRTSEKLEEAILEEKKFQNLYKSADGYHFMDLGSYEEIVIGEDILGDSVNFLQDNLEVTGLCYENKVLKINLPNFITAEIMQSDLGLKGDSTKPGTKPAVIDTGATVQVPLFIEVGEKIKLDTRTGQYVERVK